MSVVDEASRKKFCSEGSAREILFYEGDITFIFFSI
jgi:hypothetical protein